MHLLWVKENIFFLKKNCGRDLIKSTSIEFYKSFMVTKYVDVILC